MKSVSVIIPNYNGRDLMVQNLPFVFDVVNNGDQIIVVDDHSTDDSVQLFVKTYKLVEDTKQNTKDFAIFSGYVTHKKKTVEVVVVQNSANLRFAANCNRGVLFAKKELLLLLNSDVLPNSNILNYLIPHFDDPLVFAVGCSEREVDSTGKVNISGKNILHFERGMFIHNRANNMETGETAWVSGGSGLFDKKKWLQLGGFDVAYAPAYWEDVDLSFRARERGWKVLFESLAIVNHNHETTNSSEFGNSNIQNMSWRNANYFTLKNSTWLQKTLYLLWKPYWALKMGKSN